MIGGVLGRLSVRYGKAHTSHLMAGHVQTKLAAAPVSLQLSRMYPFYTTPHSTRHIEVFLRTGWSFGYCACLQVIRLLKLFAKSTWPAAVAHQAPHNSSTSCCASASILTLSAPSLLCEEAGDALLPSGNSLHRPRTKLSAPCSLQERSLQLRR